MTRPRSMLLTLSRFLSPIKSASSRWLIKLVLRNAMKRVATARFSASVYFIVLRENAPFFGRPHLRWLQIVVLADDLVPIDGILPNAFVDLRRRLPCNLRVRRYRSVRGIRLRGADSRSGNCRSRTGGSPRDHLLRGLLCRSRFIVFDENND